MRELENLQSTESRPKQCVEAGETAVLMSRCATGEAVTLLLVMAATEAKVAVVAVEVAQGPALSAMKKDIWHVNALTLVLAEATESVVVVETVTSATSQVTSLATALTQTQDPRAVPWSATSVTKRATWPEIAQLLETVTTVVEAEAAVEATEPVLSAMKRVTWPETARMVVEMVMPTSASAETLMMVVSLVAPMTVATHEELMQVATTMPGVVRATTMLVVEMEPGAATLEPQREDPKEVGEN